MPPSLLILLPIPMPSKKRATQTGRVEKAPYKGKKVGVAKKRKKEKLKKKTEEKKAEKKAEKKEKGEGKEKVKEGKKRSFSPSSSLRAFISQ